MSEREDYLEVDKPIPGQNYVCISFLSPDDLIKQKELFMFNKFVNQRCGELENKIEEIVKESSDPLRHKVQKEITEQLREQLKFDILQSPVYKHTSFDNDALC